MFTRIRRAFSRAFHEQLTQAQQEAYLNGYRQGFNEGIESGFKLGGGFPSAPPTHAWEMTFPVDLDQHRPESLDWSINREVE